MRLYADHESPSCDDVLVCKYLSIDVQLYQWYWVHTTKRTKKPIDDAPESQAYIRPPSRKRDDDEGWPIWRRRLLRQQQESWRGRKWRASLWLDYAEGDYSRILSKNNERVEDMDHCGSFERRPSYLLRTCIVVYRSGVNWVWMRWEVEEKNASLWWSLMMILQLRARVLESQMLYNSTIVRNWCYSASMFGCHLFFGQDVSGCGITQMENGTSLARALVM